MTNTSTFTQEQIKDIREREAKGLEALKELGLTPGCGAQMVNMGNDTFGIKLIPYLQDTKYTAQPSPISKDQV